MYCHQRNNFTTLNFGGNKLEGPQKYLTYNAAYCIPDGKEALLVWRKSSIISLCHCYFILRIWSLQISTTISRLHGGWWFCYYVREEMPLCWNRRWNFSSKQFISKIFLNIFWYRVKFTYLKRWAKWHKCDGLKDPKTQLYDQFKIYNLK